MKRVYRKTDVNCLNDIAEVVNQSSHVNVPQLCGMEDGYIIVPIYDWTAYLATFFHRMTGIKKYHHFEFRESCNDVMLVNFQTQMLLDRNW